MNLLNDFNRNAQALEIASCTGSTDQLVSQFYKSAGQASGFLLISVAYRDEDAAACRNHKISRNDCLIEGFLIGMSNTHNFTGGLHFRPQLDFYQPQLGEGENRCLNSYIILWWNQSKWKSGILQRFTQCYSCCIFHHINTGNLTHEWNCTAGSWVYFNYIHTVIHNNELNIDQTLYGHGNRNLLRVISQSIDNLLAQMLRRIYGEGVPGMNAGTFNLFHNSRNAYINTIGNSINFHFTANHVLVNQYRMFMRSNNGFLQVGSEFVFIIYNLHCTTAKYIAWTNDKRIIQILCLFNGFSFTFHQTAFRSGNAQLSHERIKTFSVFRHIDTFIGRSDNAYSSLGHRSSQIDSCLTAKLTDNPFRLFLFNDFHDIIHGKWFEVQSIRCIKVSGYGFRVIVDDNSLMASLAECPGCVY